MAGTVKKRKNPNKAKVKKGGWKLKFFVFCLISFLVGAVALTGYIYILDKEVQEKFTGEKWQLPVWIYSRPLELYKNQRISLKQLETELITLNYRKVYDPANPGEYAVEGNNLVVIKRPFKFYDGDEKERALFIQFGSERIQTLKDAKTGATLASARLDPIILDRITLGNEEDRIKITLQDVNDKLIPILTTIEDRDFYDHFGIKPTSIARAMIANIKAGRNVQGGSTLTQQLVKNFYLTSERSVSRKIKEALMSLIVEYRYSKNEILEAYLNEIYLGQNGSNGVYGFGLASYFYFGLPVRELDVGQIATMVAIIRGPSYYDPWRHKERTRERRDMILKKLLDEDIITPKEYDQYASKDIEVLPRGKDIYGKTPAYVDLVKREIREKMGDEILKVSGLKVFTSFDPNAQKAAENAVAKAGAEFKNRYPDIQIAFSVANWHKGEVIALVGGRDYATKGMFNRAIDAHRPIGSTIKPIVYLTGFAEKNYRLSTVIDDSALTVHYGKQEWRPRNFDHKYHGKVFLRDALARSLNIPAVRVGVDAKIRNVIKNLQAVGVDQELQPYPSLLLGTVEMSPLEMTQMFSVFASQGYYKPLTSIRAIVDKNDELIYQENETAKRIFSSEDTYLLTSGLISVVKSGTARSLNSIVPNVNIAGKTGTTDDGKDSWFAGYDNDDVFSVWVGMDDNKPTGYTGSSGALKVFNMYVKERGANSINIPMPKGIVNQRFNRFGNPIENDCKLEGSIVVPAKISTIGEVEKCYYYSE